MKSFNLLICGLISCPDKVGLVTNITRVLAANQLNIVAMREFVDEANRAFFTRIACTGELNEPEKLKRKLLENLPDAAEVNLISKAENKSRFSLLKNTIA